MFENTLNGMPICRAMILTDPQDKALFNDKLDFLDSQFLVGEDLLIAPILEPQLTGHGGRRDVYLPAHSDWYLFMDNKRPLLPITEGGTTVRNFDAHIDANSDHIGFIMPIYVRAGAIIPTIELEQYVGERNANKQPNPITLNIYPASLKEVKGEYTMYLDDGVSRSSAPTKLPGSDEPLPGKDEQAKDEYRETRITHEYTGTKTREIRVERIHDNYTPPLERYFFTAILHDPAEARGSSGPLRSITIAGHEIHPIADGTSEQRADVLNNASDNAWYYNENTNISFVKVFDNSPSITIRAEYI
jgi:alpha-glucosidase